MNQIIFNPKYEIKIYFSIGVFLLLACAVLIVSIERQSIELYSYMFFMGAILFSILIQNNIYRKIEFKEHIVLTKLFGYKKIIKYSSVYDTVYSIGEKIVPELSIKDFTW